MIIAVRNGHTAVVTAAPALGGRFRFLTGFNNGAAVHPVRGRSGPDAGRLPGRRRDPYPGELRDPG